MAERTPRLSHALFAFGLAGILGVAAAGAAVDRAPRAALLTAPGVMTVSVTTLVLMRGSAAVAATAVWGGAYAALPTLLQALVLKAAPQAQTNASALFIITFNFSITAGSVLGGQQLLTWRGPALLPVVAAALTAVAVLTAARRPGPPMDPGPAQPEPATQLTGPMRPAGLTPAPRPPTPRP